MDWNSNSNRESKEGVNQALFINCSSLSPPPFFCFSLQFSYFFFLERNMDNYGVISNPCHMYVYIYTKAWMYITWKGSRRILPFFLLLFYFSSFLHRIAAGGNRQYASSWPFTGGQADDNFKLFPSCCWWRNRHFGTWALFYFIIPGRFYQGGLVGVVLWPSCVRQSGVEVDIGKYSCKLLQNFPICHCMSCDTIEISFLLMLCFASVVSSDTYYRDL